MDSKVLEKWPRKETLQCLKRSLNKHISEMCLKLQELSWNCYFAAGKAEDGCKAVQAALEGERAQYLLFHSHQGRNFGLCAGKSPTTDSP